MKFSNVSGMKGKEAPIAQTDIKRNRVSFSSRRENHMIAGLIVCDL